MTDKLLNTIAKAKSLEELLNWQSQYLGKKGLLSQKLKALKNIADLSIRKKTGKELNQLKIQLEQAFLKRQQQLSQPQHELIDPTVPGEYNPVGASHPVTKTIEEITSIFSKIGFYRLSYPSIEYEYFAFDSLNMPANHPARDEFESFTVSGAPSQKYGKMVLTPHTSSGQVRQMWAMKNKPVRMINISRCYRRNWDITHTPMFHQFEGLCLDMQINITHLKGAIDFFVKEYFGYDVEIRLRPHHFQFTEPSFEIDTTCTVCRGRGKVKGQKCRVCKSGWLELGGAGMVHPYVLQQGKVDSKKYRGWAFGFGVERVYMMKYELYDLRKLYSGQLDIYSRI